MLRKLLLWIPVLAVVALLVFLLPPHLQVRSVSTSPPEFADLAALQRPDGPTSVHYVVNAEQSLDRGLLSHSIFVFEWPDGKLLLVDAGMRSGQAAAFAELLGTIGGGGEAVFHGNIADLLGNRVADVAGIAFTHLHIDHTEGVIALCEATQRNPALLQTRNQADKHNFNTTESAAILGASCVRPAPMNEGSIWTSDAFPGLGLIAAGGHTPGSTAFAAWVQGQLYVLSGDITNTKADILTDSGKGWVYSNLFVPEDTGQTRELRRWLDGLGNRSDTTVVVSHDLADIVASGIPELP